MQGRTLLHYRIIEKIGEGGMGVVYLALDLNLDRRVAIKLLPPHVGANPQAVDRFIHEARTASSLDHPNIGTIHEIDTTDEGQTFIVMAHYEGETLRKRIDRGRMDVDETLDIAEQIAAGLDKAHEKGIVHRDIKPSNIILTGDGRVKIVDFGLAKLEGKTRLTTEGTTLGTAAYMSPEQAKGEDVDSRSDIFSLGVLFYEMLSGELPFKGEHEAALLYEIVHEEPEPLARDDSSIPSVLQGVVKRLLEKDPGRRYQNTGELKSDLDNLIRGRAAEKHSGMSGLSIRGKSAGSSRRIPRMVTIVFAFVLIAAAAVMVLERYTGDSVQAEGMALAVMDFENLLDPSDQTITPGFSGLLNAGFIENAPFRIISPEYLLDLRRRLFENADGPIKPGHAMEVAKKAGATFFVSGQLGRIDDADYVMWRIVETISGRNIAAGRIRGGTMFELADSVICLTLKAVSGEYNIGPPSKRRTTEEMITDSPEAYRHYQAGLLAKKSVLRKKAIEELEKAVEIDTTFSLAYFELATCYWGPYEGAGSNPIMAERYVDAAWRSRSRLNVRDRMRLEALRARVLRSYKHFSEINDLYRELVQRWPDEKATLMDLTKLLFHSWQFGEAIPIAKKGIEFYPEEIDFHVLLRTSLRFVGKHEQALETQRAIVNLLQGDADSWSDLGDHFLYAGKPDSARIALNRSLELEPDYIWALKYLHYVEYSTGNIDEAILIIERLLAGGDLSAEDRLSLCMNDQTMTGGLARLYADAGRYNDAVALSEGLVADNPDCGILNDRALIRTLYRIGRYREALEAIRHAQARCNMTRDDFLNRGEYEGFILAELDSLYEAREILKEIRNRWTVKGMQRWEGIVLMLDAQIALAAGDPGSALERLSILDKFGWMSTGWYGVVVREMRARAYIMMDQPREAIREHRELLGIFGGHAESHYQLGILYEGIGQREDAIREYGIFLDMWKNADEGLPQLIDSEERLASLKAS
jgi:tetratricopeptide (TPR) repeat protein/predicted Ser/Thr protein kinase